MASRKWRVVGWAFAAVALVLAFAVGGLVTYLKYFYKRDTLFQVWSTVDDAYFDRRFNGYDWPAVGERTIRELPSGDDPKHAKRDAAISRMLLLLESSHVEYVPAWMARPAGSAAAHMNTFLQEIGSSGGLTLVQHSVPASPVVVSVEPQSALVAAGVRVGMHIAPLAAGPAGMPASAVGYQVTARDGQPLPFLIAAPASGAPQAARYDAPARRIVVSQLDGAALQALWNWKLQSLDPQTEVQFTADGLVTTLGDAGGLATIGDVAKGSPADLAGIEPGSAISELKLEQNKQILALTVTARAANGVEATMHAVAPANLDLLAEHRESRTVGNSLVLRFDAFNADNVAWATHELRSAHVERLVLDLRHNHGGDADQMKRFLAALLPGDSVIGFSRSATTITPVKVTTGQEPLALPTAVLIGPLSASAAEVTAAALQASHRAVVVGKRSAGDVVLARTYRMDDGAELQVPIADYVDAQGRRLERIGVVPDREVWNTLADIRADRDRPLETALAALGGP